MTIETATKQAWCRRCGVRAVSKGRCVVVVRDVDAFGRRVRLVWRKRRWRCAGSTTLDKHLEPFSQSGQPRVSKGFRRSRRNLDRAPSSRPRWSAG
ncbi:MAG: transposase family protein [Euzebyaceae bacterium]|nr:transposase family protein [Euzebyaceae bacterium]